jgi:hypothetical protein
VKCLVDACFRQQRRFLCILRRRAHRHHGVFGLGNGQLCSVPVGAEASGFQPQVRNGFDAAATQRALEEMQSVRESLRPNCPVSLFPGAYNGKLRIGPAEASSAGNALIWRRVRTAVDPFGYPPRHPSRRDAAIAKAAAVAIILLREGWSPGESAPDSARPR